MRSRVSVVIVSFNCKPDLKECLNSLQDQNEDIEVIIVDNNSHDGTREMLENDFKDWSSLKTIYNNFNNGFSNANNQAIPVCEGNYILFLNPDCIVKPDTISTMVSYLDSHPDVGVISPKIVYENKSLQMSFGKFPDLTYMAIAYLLPTYKRLRIPIILRYLNAEWALHQEKEVDWVSAACMMIPKTLALQLGGFDSNIFVSFADSPELCRRVKGEGFKVIYFPQIEITHKQGKSLTDQIRPQILLYAYQGYLYYFKKYKGFFSTIVVRGIYFLASLEKSIVTGLLSLFKPRQYLAIFKAHLNATLRIWFLPISWRKIEK